MTLAESFLNVDAVLIVDMSGSMSAEDAPGGLSRWQAAENELLRLQEQMPGKLAVIAFSSEVQFCPSGIPIRFGGGTDMAKALRFVKPADGLEIRFILISDGQPDSKSETLKVARGFKSRIDTVYIGPEGGSGHKFLTKLANQSVGIAAQSKAPGLLADNVTMLLAETA
jgi:Mg-chelatase subunit ChlD